MKLPSLAALSLHPSLLVSYAPCEGETLIALQQQADDCYLAAALLAAIRLLLPLRLQKSFMKSYLEEVKNNGTFSCTLACNSANDDTRPSKAPRISKPIQQSIPEFMFHYTHFQGIPGLGGRGDPGYNSDDDEDPAKCVATFKHTAELVEHTTDEESCTLDKGGDVECAFLAIAACLGVEYTYCDIQVERKQDVPLLNIPTTAGFTGCMTNLQDALLNKMGAGGEVLGGSDSKEDEAAEAARLLKQEAAKRRCVVKMGFSGYGPRTPVRSEENYNARGFNVTNLDDFHDKFMDKVGKMEKVDISVECYLVIAVLSGEDRTARTEHAFLAVPCEQDGTTKLLVCNSWGIPCYPAKDAEDREFEWDRYFKNAIVTEIACIASATR